MQLPDEMLHSQVADQNKDLLLAAVRQLSLPSGGHVLEIASGTGQHVTHLAAGLPELTFHPSDVNSHMLATLRKRLADEPLSNVCPPRVADAAEPDTWPVPGDTCRTCSPDRTARCEACRTRAHVPGWLDAVLCINMTHVAPPESWRGLLTGAGRWLRPGGALLLYGPFQREGKIPANLETFQQRLQQENPSWGLRDVSELCEHAESCGLRLESDTQPAPNQSLLVWRRRTADPGS
ncbi:methyltransferase-like 26 [Amphibalanus amphitrite]|uniref:methyltransferase-like 26 n=1 Tax=Amphibalanus amphitrite TaxID=1232801 RepID=UPI001C9023AA|nr:methyltransferase-like 26 [Amphibalanus amphitrite]